jgi:hypothetical protein
VSDPVEEGFELVGRGVWHGFLVSFCPH